MNRFEAFDLPELLLLLRSMEKQEEFWRQNPDLSSEDSKRCLDSLKKELAWAVKNK
ncbi:MAG: hypothetical protein VKK04_25670 [Synechococcales bacterium]|nr:hypothetical protein [Synechococcales bacterium]